ncbi:phytanoyl-CoA dioxygenase family protein [Nocardia sp. NPDC004068]|uniref:phytanoyl-CoA dioxygenase family protein n=1 Tax=Nocardia sp. NPDC004068 TaxID=3364303 RepID=UPI0036B811A3
MLTAQEREQFIENGVLVKRSAIPAEVVRPAQSLIADWIARGDWHKQVKQYTQRTFAPELESHPRILELYSYPWVSEAVRALVAKPCAVEKAQIQIRLPDAWLSDQQPIKAMHVDGVACPHLDPRELRTFSLLVGVVLSDINDPNGGPLRYQTGGHLRMAEWFRDEWSLGITDQTPPDIGNTQGHPFFGAPGDVLLMHHLVPHSVGQNFTLFPRVMVYFRVSHVDHASRRLEALKDPWLDFSTLSAPR